jgi:hypothetical protein
MGGASPDIDVFIVGTVFSGSTLIGNALGTHDDVLFAGEVAALPLFSKTYGVMHAIDGCLACAELGRPCETWTRERIAAVEAAGLGGYADVLRRETGRRVIVDGSKSAQWLRLVGEKTKLDPERTRVIVSSKDPFSFADSFIRREGIPAWQAANLWRDTYVDVFRTLAAARVLHTHVAYADLSRDTAGTLKRLCALVGVSYDRSLLGFRTRTVCSIGGNLGAHVGREGIVDALRKKTEWHSKVEARHWETYEARGGDPSYSDQKWTERLRLSDLTQIVQTPGLTDLASLLGYDLVHLARLVRR